MIDSNIKVKDGYMVKFVPFRGCASHQFTGGFDLICFSIIIRQSSESKRFCTFGLNSGCLITFVVE